MKNKRSEFSAVKNDMQKLSFWKFTEGSFRRMKAIYRTPGISFPLSPLEIHLCNKQHYENSEFLNLKIAFFQKK